MKNTIILIVILLTTNVLSAQLDDPNFFPKAVWLQRTTNAQAYKDIGINMYIGLYYGLDQGQLNALSNKEMYVICEQNEFGLEHKSNPWITAWSQIDEPDNAQWNPTTMSFDPCIDPEQIINIYNDIKSNDPVKPVYLNLGRGVSDLNWIGRGTCTGKINMYKEEKDGYLAGADIVSFDIYPVNNEPSDLTTAKIWYVPRGIKNLQSWVINPKPTWTWIETTQINDDGYRKPTTAEVKAEVWMAIVQGATGIGYFCHSWVPILNDDAVLSDNEMIDTIKSINAMLDQYAPIINSPTINDYATIESSEFAIPISILTKKHEDHYYIFSISQRSGDATGTFTIPEGSTIEVKGENRTIEETGGQFVDDFSDYKLHIYKILSPNTTNNYHRNKPDIILSPNPTNGIASIEPKYNGSIYEILSINGKAQKKGVIRNSLINISDRENGLYMVKVIDKKTGLTHLTKLIKTN